MIDCQNGVYISRSGGLADAAPHELTPVLKGN